MKHLLIQCICNFRTTILIDSLFISPFETLFPLFILHPMLHVLCTWHMMLHLLLLFDDECNLNIDVDDDGDDWFFIWFQWMLSNRLVLNLGLETWNCLNAVVSPSQDYMSQPFDGCNIGECHSDLKFLATYLLH